MDRGQSGRREHFLCRNTKGLENLRYRAFRIFHYLTWITWTGHGKVPKEIIAYRLGRSGIQTGDEAYTKITPEIEKRFLKEVK